MSSSDSASAPIYILKWRMLSRQRGRRHMAIFVPNPQHRNVSPAEFPRDCLGTLLHVVGNPFGGFVLNIQRNWNQTMTDGVESIHFLSSVDGQHAPEPTSTEFVPSDQRPKGLLYRLASNVRPPGVSSNTSHAESIFDCQDWVYDYMNYLLRKHVIEAAVLDTLHPLLDSKVPLTSQAGFTSSSAHPLTASIARVTSTSTNQLEQPLTASIARAPSASLGQAAQPSEPAQPTRGRYTNSDFDPERGVYRRYDNTLKQWQFRDRTGPWKPWE